MMRMNGELPANPTFCCMEISTACILRCKMCFVWKNERRQSPPAVSLDEWRSFIDSMSALITESPITMNFSGAEPLYDERNLSLVNFSKRKGFFTSMCTNGFLIDEAMAHKIAESGLDVMIISLDGMNRGTHDFIRGVDGCYDRVMRAIDHLDKVRGGLEIGIQTIILGSNLDEIVRMAEWVNLDKRLNFINFQAVASPFDLPFDKEWYRRSEYDFLWPKDTKKASDTINELIRLKEAGFKIANSVSQMRVFKKYFERPQTYVKNNPCNVGSWMNVNQSGDVYLCRLKKPIGNIKKDAPHDIWHSQEADSRRQEIKNCKTNCHLLINCCYEEEQFTRV